MFQLLVSIIAVVVVVAVTAAAIFYGGDVFKDSASDAQYVKYKNEASQIEGAARIYRVDNGEFPADDSGSGGDTSLEKLISYNYLKSVPDSDNLDMKWAISQDYIVRQIDSSGEAEALNEAAGYDDQVPVCGDTAGSIGPVADEGQPACNCTGSASDYCS